MLVRRFFPLTPFISPGGISKRRECESHAPLCTRPRDTRRSETITYTGEYPIFTLTNIVASLILCFRPSSRRNRLGNTGYIVMGVTRPNVFSAVDINYTTNAMRLSPRSMPPGWGVASTSPPCHAHSIDDACTLRSATLVAEHTYFFKPTKRVVWRVPCRHGSGDAAASTGTGTYSEACVPGPA